MKNKIAMVALLGLSVAVNAEVFVVRGVKVGTVCRSGPWFIKYPPEMALPLGTACAVRAPNGTLLGRGVITDE